MIWIVPLGALLSTAGLLMTTKPPLQVAVAWLISYVPKLIQLEQTELDKPKQ